MSPSERPAYEQDPVVTAITRSWQLGLVVGVITLALGIIVTLHPSTSLNVICVLIGVAVMIGGLFRLVISFDGDNPHRAVSAIVGVLMLVVGLVLIRHLNVTRLLVAFVVGLAFIVQGIVDLLVGFSGETRGTRAWPIIIGLVSLAAGIVVIAVPENSVKALAVLVGISFIVIGALEIVGSLVLRHALKQAGDA